MLPSPVYAALDLGSNSFHLLIATFSADKLVIIDDLKVMVQLAADIKADKTFDEGALARAQEALVLFADRLRSIDRRYLRVIGTSALRQAKNTDAFLQTAEHILNAPIDIISGAEEARLIFLGVNKDYSPTVKRLIIDIGGGSTECVVGQFEPEVLKSLHIGCLQYTQLFFPEGKITAKRYQEALLRARAEVGSATELFAQAQWQEAVGASGTVRGIGQILCDEYQNSLITLPAIEQLAADIIKTGHCRNLKYSALSDSRRSVLPGGVAILHALFIELNITEMHVCDQAIREGVIYEMDGRTCYNNRREKTITQLQQVYQVDSRQADVLSVTAQKIYRQLMPNSDNQMQMLELLIWAAQLHEIGLVINHSGYHKHGAYIIENSSMPGFSQQIQQSIAYLVSSHRRKIRPFSVHYRVTQSKPLLIALRMAFIFCRYRDVSSLPKTLAFSYSENQLLLKISPRWLARYPLISADLKQEAKYLAAIDVQLKINPEVKI